MSISNRVKKVIFIMLLVMVGLGAGTILTNVVTANKIGRFIRPVIYKNAPNVVLVVIDTLRADHLTQYGYKRQTSPGLKRFVAESVLFSKAFSTSSWTVPGTASILSGLHPARHRATRSGHTLNGDIVTIAEQLKKAGYETAGFSHNIYVSTKTNYDQGFDTFFGHKSKSPLAYPDISKMMKRVKRWLHRHKNAERPFFIYMQPMNCHGPYRVPKSHRADLLSRRPRRGFRYYKSPMSDIMWRGDIEKRSKVTKPYLKSLIERYDTAIRYTTDQIGDLFHYLRRNGLWDNTVVVLTADHGEELFDHGGFSHGYTLFNEVLHVPLIIKLPGQHTPSRTHALVSVMDIYPTILGALNLPAGIRLDGRALLPFFDEVNDNYRIDTEGATKKFKRRTLLFDLNWKERGVMKGWLGKYYKYIDVKHDYSGRKKANLLYKIGKDPKETENLAEANKKVVRRLKRSIAKRWRTFRSIRYDEGENVLEEMNIDALKALGYIL